MVLTESHLLMESYLHTQYNIFSFKECSNLLWLVLYNHLISIDPFYRFSTSHVTDCAWSSPFFFWISPHRFSTHSYKSYNVILLFWTIIDSLIEIYPFQAPISLYSYLLYSLDEDYHSRNTPYQNPYNESSELFLLLLWLSTAPIVINYAISERSLFHWLKNLNRFYNIWCLWGICIVVITLNQTLLTLKNAANTCLLSKCTNLL